jgi:hypothetical protein
MTGLHVVSAVLALALCVLAAGWGAWAWWQGDVRGFWPLLRLAQAAIVLQALIGGLLLVLGRSEPGSLHTLYGVLPVGVMFFAEQLRIAAADQVLSARDLEDAAAVGRLDDAGQRSVVMAIVRRELMVMAAAAGVCALLLLRAWGTAG